jgi:subtilisin-like proprotein convertase family protein
MNRFTIRASRVTVVAGLVTSCWFAAGASSQRSPQQQPVMADFGQRVGLSDFTIQNVDFDAVMPGGELAKQFAFDLMIDGVQKRIDLQQHNLGPEMVVLEQVADGSIRYVPPMSIRTYRGVIDGEANSSVAASVTPDGGLVGIIFQDDQAWGFQPLSELEPGADPKAHVVYRQDDVVLPPGVCGTVTDVHDENLEHGEGGIAGSGFTGGVTADLAFDADFEFFLLNGSSTPNTVADITAVINGVDAMYQREAGIAFRITTILVRTAEPDPYSSSDAATLLSQVQAHWNAFQGPVVRDHAQLMTGKNLGGTLGIAFLNAMCSNMFGSYSVVRSRWQPIFAGRVSLSGHEIAHSFNAAHCGGATCGMMCMNIDSCASSMLSWDAGTTASVVAKRNSGPCLSALTARGACCVGSTCTQTTQQQCLLAGGTWTLNAACATRSLYTNTPNAAIPDGVGAHVPGAPLIRTQVVPDSFTISDMNLRLNIPHTWMGDLTVDISHDGVNFVRVIDRIGLPSIGPEGCPSNNLNVVLDDEGTGGPIDLVCSLGGPAFPVSGPSFVPQNPLSFFNGQNASGTWTIRIMDFFLQDVGTLNSWTLDFERSGTSICVPTGSCCVGSTCSQQTQAQCTAMSGTWTQGQACFTEASFNTNANVAIPDGPPTGVSHVFNVPGNFTINDLNLGLVLTHTWVGDLTVRLTHGATTVTLIDRPGVPNPPPAGVFGCDGDNYNIVLDDEGTGGAIENLCSPGGINPTSPPNYTPSNPLSAFDGQNIGGNWTLFVSDVVTPDAGVLVSWRLIAPDPATGACVDCPEDIDNDGDVDVDDLIAVILDWGCAGVCGSDVDNDGDVDVDDLIAVILGWGLC